MAISTALNCSFPQDLDAASYALLQELANRSNNSLIDLQNIATDADLKSLNGLLDNGLDLINQALALGDLTSKDLESSLGLPADQPTSKEIEEYLSKVGVLVNGGLLLVPSTNENVTPIRRIYMAYGADYEKTYSSLNVSGPRQALFNLGVVKSEIIPKQFADRQMTLSELRDFTKIDYLKNENVTTLQDGRQLIVYRKFLDTDKSIDSVANTYGFSKSSLTTSVFHFDVVDNSVAAIQRYQNLGYSGPALTAILTPSDYQEVSTDPLSTSIKSSKNLVAAAINGINFLLKSFENQTPAGIKTFRDNLSKDLTSIKEAHLQIIAESYFYVTNITDRSLLQKLSKSQSNQDLKTLFIDRDDITGVDLDASDSEKLQIFQVSLADTVGSSRVSNAHVNKIPRQEKYDKKILVDMFSFLVDASELNSNQKISNDPRYGQFFFSKDYLNKIKSFLVLYSETSPLNPTLQEGVIKSGYESFISGSGAVLQVIDIDKTFNTDGKLSSLDSSTKELKNYFPPAVAQVMSSILNVLKSIFSSAFNALKRLMEALRGRLMALKNKFDSFMSKLNALIGNGDLSFSILGCKLSSNVSISFKLIDDLFSLLNVLQNEFAGFLSRMLKFCTDLLDKVICYPSKILSGVLPPEALAAPSICSKGLDFVVQWPPDVTKALDELKSIPDAYMLPFSSLASDILKASLSLNTFPEKINQFKLSAACETSLFGQFSNAANLNFLSANLGVANPLVGLQTSVFGPAGALKGFGL